MKKSFLTIGLIAFTAIILIGCQNKNSDKQNNDGYVNEVDTFYVPNSLDIDRIETTFYKLQLEDGTLLTMTNSNKDTTKTAIVFQTKDKEFGVMIVPDKQLEKFFSDINVVLKNPDKRLEFFITDKDIIIGKIEYGWEDNSVRICSTELTALSIGFASCKLYFSLNQEELDKMINVYKKFKNKT